MTVTYREAGVDIDAGNELVKRIKPLAAKTARPELLASIGGFAALFELPVQRYKNPVLVSSTDGVGTKLTLAQQLNRYDTIGIDLVAMCVNDLIVTGAEPLFFLDYYATGKLDVDAGAAIIQGISEGCLQANASLVGGETAEMPGVYQKGDFDLAGFSVGVVEKNSIIDGSRVQAGDVILGLGSSGVHSNGFSLVRKIIDNQQADLTMPFAGSTLGETLLTPTRIYVRALLALLQRCPVHAMAHITGGGLLENIPRVLPKNLCAKIDHGSWKKPAIFDWLQEKGPISDNEMLRTFNCGIGMTIILPAHLSAQAQQLLQGMNETVYAIGEIVPRLDPTEPQVILE